MIKDEQIKFLVKHSLAETREKKLDGSRGRFQEVSGFVFFIDIKNSTEAFLIQQDWTYLKFMHAFYAGVYHIFKAYGIREDSIKFLGDGILGVCLEELSADSPRCPFLEISKKIVILIYEIINNLGATHNNIIEGVKISIVPTLQHKLYRGKTGAYGESRIEYNGLAINQAINITKMHSNYDFFASMRIFGYHYHNYINLGDGVFEHNVS